MPCSDPESTAFLLMGYYSPGLAHTSPCPHSGHGRGRRLRSCSQLWHTASITVGSNAAFILLPAGAAWHAAEVIHGPALPLQVEREQKSFPVSLDRIRETTAENVGAACCRVHWELVQGRQAASVSDPGR